MPRTASTRWTSAATCRPGGSRSSTVSRRWRPTPMCGPWAGAGSPSRSWSCWRPRPAGPSTRTPPGSTPTSTAGSASELSLEYSLLGLQGLNYTPYEWTAADSVAWLKVMAWDLGVQPGSGDRAVDHHRGRGRRPGSQPVPELPARGLRADPAPGHGRRQSVRPVGSAVLGPAPAGSAGRDRTGGAGGAGRGGPDERRPGSGPRRARHGGGDRLELLGPRRLPDRKRSGPAVQRPPPGHADPVRVRPGGAALPDGSPMPARTTSPVSAWPRCPVW